MTDFLGFVLLTIMALIFVTEHTAQEIFAGALAVVFILAVWAAPWLVIRLAIQWRHQIGDTLGKLLARFSNL